MWPNRASIVIGIGIGTKKAVHIFFVPIPAPMHRNRYRNEEDGAHILQSTSKF